ncbi:hypothetical protein [Flavobacterium sp. LC2016-01]|uniref:hypothetical protein n=1 Tax=Flavobacterium sp. LC2016-01 TaxID=2675876 RepID=UPI0012BAE8D1|nr:hypothetical protein [Flavobacterium sp. LC2016-01]MTH14538.1 hypothetical protein [Flavobacterium sp. LC2016-01]
MKVLIKLSFIFFCITISGCAGENIDCTTPPNEFVFQFIDKNTGEDLLSNGKYDPKTAIIVTDLNTANIIRTVNIINGNSYYVSIRDIGWQTEKINYVIAFFQGKSIFELKVDAERINKKCSYTKYNSIEIKNADFQFDKTTGIYKILIDTK